MTADVVALLTRLVAADSVNPSLVTGGAGEAEAARVVREFALAAGLDADVLEATPGRPSVVVRARGTGGGRTAGAGAHATEEWVSIASTMTVTETLIAAGRRFCG